MKIALIVGAGHYVTALEYFRGELFKFSIFSSFLLSTLFGEVFSVVKSAEKVKIVHKSLP